MKTSSIDNERKNTYQLRMCDFMEGCSCHSNNLVPEELEKTDDKNCLIQVSTETRKLLQELGHMGSSYNSVIQRLVKHVDVCQLWWENQIE